MDLRRGIGWVGGRREGVKVRVVRACWVAGTSARRSERGRDGRLPAVGDELNRCTLNLEFTQVNPSQNKSNTNPYT